MPNQLSQSVVQKRSSPHWRVCAGLLACSMNAVAPGSLALGQVSAGPEGTKPTDVPPSQGRADDNAGLRIGGSVEIGQSTELGPYAIVVLADVLRALGTDPALAHAPYTIRLEVMVSSGGVAAARVLTGSGDTQRDALVQARLNGLQLSQRPPTGVKPIRLTLNSRSGA